MHTGTSTCGDPCKILESVPAPDWRVAALLINTVHHIWQAVLETWNDRPEASFMM